MSNNTHINIVQINAALGVLLSGSFIEAPQPEGLGVKRDEVPGAAKRAVFWKATDYPTIVDRFGAYVASRRGVNVVAMNGDRPPKKAADGGSATPPATNTATTGQGAAADPFANDTPAAASTVADPFADSAPAASTVVDPFA